MNVNTLGNPTQQNDRVFYPIWQSLRTCDSDRQFEQTIRGFDFACIARACGLGMVHFIVDYSENLRRPHYG